VSGAPALRVRGLVKRFQRGLLRSASAEAAVAGVDLEVAQGERVGLIGESGSGKTTLARAALGLVPYELGVVEILGFRLDRMKIDERRRFRRRFQLLFQNAEAHLNPGLRVQEILRESARLHRPAESAGALIEATLQQVGLTHRSGAWPHQLSGGEKRRVGIARILLTEPDLIVADEPTAGLDAGLKADIIDLLLTRRDARRGYLLISHDLPLVAYACQRVVVMYAGRVVEEFPVDHLRSGPHHPYTQALLAAAGLVPNVARHATLAAGRVSPGCPYLGPCTEAVLACGTLRPLLVELGPSHRIACHARGVMP